MVVRKFASCFTPPSSQSLLLVQCSLPSHWTRNFQFLGLLLWVELSSPKWLGIAFACTKLFRALAPALDGDHRPMTITIFQTKIKTHTRIRIALICLNKYRLMLDVQMQSMSTSLVCSFNLYSVHVELSLDKDQM